MLLCDSGVDVSSSLLLASAILMAVREQLFHSSRCLNFRNRLRPLGTAQAVCESKLDVNRRAQDQPRRKKSLFDRLLVKCDGGHLSVHGVVCASPILDARPQSWR